MSPGVLVLDSQTMAGYVCTVAGGKGGVGKTTTAIDIAAVLEANGHDTVVVDADLGMANLGDMLGLSGDGSIHEVLAGEATVSETLTDGPGGMAVVPGEQSLEAFAEADPAKLRKVINTLESTFDVVLVDTGAGLSHETMVPLGLADGILLVTTPDDVAVSDTIKTAELAGRVDGAVVGAIITRVTRDTDIQGIAERFEFPLLGVIPADAEATRAEPLVMEAPGSDPAEAYEQLTGALEPVFFDGATGDDLERVFDEEWFRDEEDTEDENDDGGGVFGGLFG
jgi:septum site-determining protein MinD